MQVFINWHIPQVSVSHLTHKACKFSSEWRRELRSGTTEADHGIYPCLPLGPSLLLLSVSESGLVNSHDHELLLCTHACKSLVRRSRGDPEITHASVVEVVLSLSKASLTILLDKIHTHWWARIVIKLRRSFFCTKPTSPVTSITWNYLHLLPPHMLFIIISNSILHLLSLAWSYVEGKDIRLTIQYRNCCNFL